MSQHDQQEEPLADAVLARLPEWQPTAGFAHRVAALAALERDHTPWAALVLRALGLAACVSIAAWLGGETFSAALRSAEGQQSPGAVSWMLAMASLIVAWRCVRRARPLRA
jgi:hypothetical protein